MARLRALVALAALLAVAPASTAAQSLPWLHVTALGMHADKARVAPGETFHVTIHVHVRERPARLDELVLPTLSNALDLGDERRRVVSADGTDFYETMTVAAQQPGTAAFSPAYLDAIDPVSSKPFRYSSNALRVPVAVASVPLSTLERQWLGALRGGAIALAAVVGIALLALLAFAGARAARKRRRLVRPAAAPPPPPASAPRPTPPADPLRAAAEAFRVRGDDASLDTLRSALFVRAGAAPGATLADALRALGDRDVRLARALAVAERARFGPPYERTPAARDLLSLLDTLLAVGAL